MTHLLHHGRYWRQQSRGESSTGTVRAEQRLPITPAILTKLQEVWENKNSDPDHIMLWAACCTCYFGFLRSGEITVPSHAQYDKGAHLSAGDVTVDRANNPSMVRVHIKASKTDPFVKVSSCLWDEQTIVYVQWLQLRHTWHLEAAWREGPFFKFANGETLSRERLVRRVQEALELAGIDARKYSGHSFRIGAVTTAASVGLKDSLIKILGWWESTAYQWYVRISGDILAGVSQQLC